MEGKPLQLQYLGEVRWKESHSKDKEWHEVGK